MSLNYNKIKNHPTTFHRLFGLSVDEFEHILKAGGPYYLPCFAVERTISDNTMAMGGNVELLNLEE